MNLFKDLPNNLDEEVFEDLLTHKNLRIERIVSTGQTSPE
ncbi:cupin, partial [Vibrio parahaemolyticus]